MMLTADTEAEFAAALDQALETPGDCDPDSAEAADSRGPAVDRGSPLMSFDTLTAVRNLEEAGLDSAQAEAITKADLAALELRLTWRILGGVGALRTVPCCSRPARSSAQWSPC
jgi:hypothetical protein